MSGKSAQDKRKAAKRAADMTILPAGDESKWQPPPPEVRNESFVSTFDAPGCRDGKNRIKVRIVSHTETGALIEFNIVHQTFHRGKWRDVASADSCHDDEVHVHRYARSSDARVGNPETLVPVRKLADIQTGYDVAYDTVVDKWVENRGRWDHG